MWALKSLLLVAASLQLLILLPSRAQLPRVRSTFTFRRESFHLRPFDSIWEPLIPWESLWFHLRPFDFVWDPLIPFPQIFSSFLSLCSTVSTNHSPISLNWLFWSSYGALEIIIEFRASCSTVHCSGSICHFCWPNPILVVLQSKVMDVDMEFG